MPIEYKLIRSNRKTLSIQVDGDCEIIVKAPLRASKAQIDEIVERHRRFIENSLERRRTTAQQIAAFRMTYEYRPCFLGQNYDIKVTDEDRIGFDGISFYMPGDMPGTEIMHVLELIYKSLAKKYMPDRVNHWAKIMNVSPMSVKITSAKTRWGSCSTKNTVNFSWRLILASPKAIDSVVVHELAHMTEHNHSEKFWATVNEYCPDYETAENELRQLSKKFSTEGWDI